MQRIDRCDLEIQISVMIACAPKLVRRAMAPTLNSAEAEKALALRIADWLDNEQRGVFRTGPPAGIPFGDMDSAPPRK